MLHTPVPSNPPNARRYEPVVAKESGSKFDAKIGFKIGTYF